MARSSGGTPGDSPLSPQRAQMDIDSRRDEDADSTHRSGDHSGSAFETPAVRADGTIAGAADDFHEAQPEANPSVLDGNYFRGKAWNDIVRKANSPLGPRQLALEEHRFARPTSRSSLKRVSTPYLLIVCRTVHTWRFALWNACEYGYEKSTV